MAVVIFEEVGSPWMPEPEATGGCVIMGGSFWASRLSGSGIGPGACMVIGRDMKRGGRSVMGVVRGREW